MSVMPRPGGPLRQSFLVFAVCFFAIASLSVMGQSDLAFPHMAVGGSPAFETVLQIISEVETSAAVTIDVFQGGTGPGNGSPLSVRFDGGAATTSRSLQLTPFQELSTIITSADGTLRNGWVRVRSTTTGAKLSGSLIFRLKNTAGTVTESVGVTSPQRFRHSVIQVDNREAGSDTGVAFINPDSTPVTVTLDLFQGLNPAAPTVTATLQPNQHFARLVSEMFPTFLRQQGTLVVETAANRSIPFVTLRLDGANLTSLPVRPLGFVFQYTVRDTANTIVETGYWLFDFVGFDLVGTGRVETPTAADLGGVSGSWAGTNFQFRYRKVFPDNSIGMVVFNGTSAGQESTVDSGSNARNITGKVTTIRADGTVASTNNFTAFHKFGNPPAN